MSCQAKNIIDWMNRLAPAALAESWDHPGLGVGDVNQTVNKILFALDVTPSNVNWAASHDIDMIVTHHPFLFNGIHAVDLTTARGKMIQKLIENHITTFSAHTNLDTAKDGVNDVLARKLDLCEIKGLVKTHVINGKNEYMGRIGIWPEPQQGLDALRFIKERLEIPVLRYAGDPDRIVKTIAVLGGAGSEFSDVAKSMGADIYVTGDIKYHEAQDADYKGLLMVDGGHFYTEFPVVHQLAELCKKEKFDVQIFEDPTAEDFIHYL